MTTILEIAPNGTVRHLHSEDATVAAIDAALGGPVHIQRASEVEFNNTTRHWEVRLPGSDPTAPPLFSDPSRAACLTWEHDHILDHLPS